MSDLIERLRKEQGRLQRVYDSGHESVKRRRAIKYRLKMMHECSGEIERLQRGRDIQKGNAERWEKLAIQYKREIERLQAENRKLKHDINRYVEIANEHVNANARLREALEKAQGELINLQPHIPQACKPGHESFIDTYVDKALLVIEEALKGFESE